MLSIAIQFLVVALVCGGLIKILIPLAPRLGLVDKPDARKQHDGEVPLVGGIAIYGALVTAAVLFGFEVVPPVLLALAGGLLLLGIADDLYKLSPRARLFWQVAVATAMCWFGGVRIESVGDIVGTGPVELYPWLVVPFTVFCTVGVINATNMIDGLDGLAGSILAVTFGALALLAALARQTGPALMLALVTCCLLVFLYFNARLVRDRAATFLGDSGSMMLGLVLCWYLITLSQGSDAAFSPIAAGWLLGIPLIDVVVVVAVRKLEGRGAFEAGRDHLHHRIRDLGLDINPTIGWMGIGQGTLVGGAVLAVLAGWIGPAAFWAFVVLVVVAFTASLRMREGVSRPPVPHSVTTKDIVSSHAQGTVGTTVNSQRPQKSAGEAHSHSITLPIRPSDATLRAESTVAKRTEEV